jgi:AcrR family transcriptional regulator
MPKIRADSIEAHKEQTRRHLLAAAHAILAETRSARLDLAEVAYRARIGRTTLYEYFRDRDDVIASLVEERLPQVVAGVIASVREQVPGDRLLALAEALLSFVVDDPVLGSILHRELPKLSEGAQDRIRLAHLELSVEMGRVYREGVAAGVFRPMPPDLAGRLLQDVVQSAARVLFSTPDPAARLGEVGDALRAFLAGGFGTR